MHQERPSFYVSQNLHRMGKYIRACLTGVHPQIHAEAHMSHISFVVASTPRSGTSYTALALNASHIYCGHEAYFDVESQTTTDDHRSDFGDSTWMAGTFISQLPQEKSILHQIGDPVKCINSMINTGHFLFSSSTNKYVNFIKRHVCLSLPLASIGKSWRCISGATGIRLSRRNPRVTIVSGAA
jgi:hypothetical protein